MNNKMTYLDKSLLVPLNNSQFVHDDDLVSHEGRRDFHRWSIEVYEEEHFLELHKCLLLIVF